jgi:hypothetical protein
VVVREGARARRLIVLRDVVRNAHLNAGRLRAAIVLRSPVGDRSEGSRDHARLVCAPVPAPRCSSLRAPGREPHSLNLIARCRTTRGITGSALISCIRLPTSERGRSGSWWKHYKPVGRNPVFSDLLTETPNRRRLARRRQKLSASRLMDLSQQRKWRQAKKLKRRSLGGVYRRTVLTRRRKHASGRRSARLT